ncbi:hypothetical protein HDV03_004780 [Kappamyces sp. JEL0829]|nr:hypothetical protein HDV03_004780 [Kappamyces sp. JEL0829]
MQQSLWFLLMALVQGQDGVSPTGSTTNPFAGYNCPSSCVRPKCSCASPNAPVANPPQFFVLTFDDAVQDSLIPTAKALFGNRKNPNGCPVGATWYAQVLYSNPYTMTQWYAQGNEIGDHSVTHSSPFAGSYAEIEGMRAWATTFAGIPRGKIQGVRFPFRNYSQAAIEQVAAMGFTYDSSMAASGADSTWPYTLDYGVVTECGGQYDLCGKKINAPGFWELPMYSTQGPEGPHLMDPYNDYDITNPIKPSVAASTLLANFQTHYTGNRAPFGLYVHPLWLGPAIPPSIPDGAAKLAAMNGMIDSIMKNPDVWMVTGSQVIEYMKNPVPASELGKQPYMQCYNKPTASICNGASDATFAQTCGLPSGSFQTCYNCPTDTPSLKTPVPPLANTKRCAVPDTCDMIYWDPVGCKCTCIATTQNSTYCAAWPNSRMDNTQAIQAQLDAAAKNPPNSGQGSPASPATGGSSNGTSGGASVPFVSLGLAMVVAMPLFF